MREDYQALGLSCFGPASFLKVPITTPGAGWAADVAFLGIPFDQATGFRSGARWGPRAIRDISVRFSAVSAPGQPGYWDPRSGLDRATCTVVDCGDVEIVPLLWETDFEMITGAVGAILAKGAFPLIAGGDHAVTFPCVRAFEGRGPIIVVQIDAHLDYRDEAMGVRYGHGNVLRRVRELPFDRVVSAGVRSLRTRREDAKAHQDDGVELMVERLLPEERHLDISIYRVFGEVEVAGWRAGRARPSVAVGFGGAVAGASG